MLEKIGEIPVLILLVGHRCFCLDFLFGGLKGITHSCGASTKDPIFLRTPGDVRKFYLQILFVSWKESNEPSCFGVVPPRSPKSYRAPIGKDRLPFPPFSGVNSLLNFGECIYTPLMFGRSYHTRGCPFTTSNLVLKVGVFVPTQDLLLLVQKSHSQRPFGCIKPIKTL